MATLVEVAAELEKLGYTTQIVTTTRLNGSRAIMRCLNVYGDDKRKPDATVWGPKPPLDNTWVWGHSFELAVDDGPDVTAQALAEQIVESLA